MTIETQLDDLLPPKSFAGRYSEIVSEPALRYQIFMAADNGLEEAGAIVRVGRKILIDVPRYRDWLLRHRLESQPLADRR